MLNLYVLGKGNQSREGAFIWEQKSNWNNCDINCKFSFTEGRFIELLDMYKISYNKRNLYTSDFKLNLIEHHKPMSEENSFLIIFLDDYILSSERAFMNDDEYFNCIPSLEDFPPIIWALNENVKIILDFAGELLNNDLHRIIKKNENLIKNNNVKILTNWNQDVEPPPYIIDSNFFEYQTRVRSDLNGSNLNLFPTNDKKYLYTLFTGDMKKTFNQSLLTKLMYADVLKYGFYTSILDTVFERNSLDHEINGDWERKKICGELPSKHQGSNYIVEKWPYLTDDEKKWLKNNWQKVYKHKVAGNLGFYGEASFHQEHHESYYCYIVETHQENYGWESDWTTEENDKGIFIPSEKYKNWNQLEQHEAGKWLDEYGINSFNFYTEKTFKYIYQGVPFFIINKNYNKNLKKFYGYELFEELFDYSIENVSHTNAMVDSIKDQILHFNKNGIDTNNKIILEKIQFNRNHFLKRSSRETLENEINRIFYESWD